MYIRQLCRSTRALFIGLILSGAVSVLPARAQTPTGGDYDPPGRVGRLTSISGTVSFRPAADTEWGVADPNRPVSNGDRVWSDNDGQSEIQMGTASLRVWHQTEVDVAQLDDHSLQLTVPQGDVILRLSAFTPGDGHEIDTPNSAITPGSIGEYRVDVSADGLTTTVTVWSGTAEVASAGSSFALAARQVAIIRGDAAPTYDVTTVESTDDFDSWSQSRDQREDHAERRYVSSDMPGVEDLDENGTWSSDADYGPIWYPSSVAVDWVPYHTGHWVWAGRWGWTWVDEAPWGWAPYHYGRWAYRENRWGWCPGRVIAPVVFAPALVVFVGGSGWNGGAAFGAGGGIAWFPLGPGEVYRPSYAVSRPYLQRVNVTTVTNVTNITNITNVTNVTNVTYVNRTVPGAVTAVSRETFVSAAYVNRAAVKVSAAEIERAPVVGTGAMIVPTQASLVARGNTRIVAPSVAVQQRTVVALHAPPPAPVPFAAQVKTIESNGGRPLSTQQVTTIRQSTPSTPAPAMYHVVSAAAKPANGATLKPARQGLPEVVTAASGSVPRAMVVPPATAAARPTAATQANRPAGTAAETPARPTTATAAEATARPATATATEAAARPTTPATESPARAGATPPEPARVTATEPAAAPRPPETPPARPAPIGPPAPTPRSPAAYASPALTSSYAAQQSQQEARHVQEFAKPPAGESPQALAARQEAEHRTLESNYHQAAVAGKTAMPPAPAPTRPSPVPPPTPTHPGAATPPSHPATPPSHPATTTSPESSPVAAPPPKPNSP